MKNFTAQNRRSSEGTKYLDTSREHCPDLQLRAAHGAMDRKAAIQRPCSAKC
jgi:hypothetical protein